MGIFGKLSQEDKVKYDENRDIGEAINEAFYHNDKDQLKDIKMSLQIAK
ncbi:hypothetical protein SDC49_22220 [Lactobacillus sp. R2/2]|nr:hypothetical protein [Lactobacillus sp. R2/2]MEB3365284.1 hypothetical protein [Lactobacillus sp. R2/2]